MTGKTIVEANGSLTSLGQWAVGLVLATVLLGWVGLFYFAQAAQASMVRDIQANRATATANAATVLVITSQLSTISDDIKEIKRDVRELREP